MLTLLQRAGRAAALASRDPAAARLSVRIAFSVIVVSVAARVTSLPRALRLMSPRAASSRDATVSPGAIADCVDLVLRLRFWVFEPSCWKRAAVLHRYLALRGVPTQIVFGVQRPGPGGPVRAHAWLEADGKPVFEAQTLSYQPIYVFPSGAEARR